MNWLAIVIVVQIFASNTVAYEENDSDFKPPNWLPVRSSISGTNDNSLSLGTDKKSGCICRGNPNRWLLCFGRDSCESVPHITNFLVDLLRIKSTMISKISRQEFDKYPYLKELEVEGNSRLTRIETGSFRKLSKLNSLSISYNANLNRIELGTFDGLKNLINLYLVKNGFDNILDVTPSLGPRSLPKLKKVSLNENEFVNIWERDFEPLEGSQIEEISLVLCQIEYIHENALKPLRKLQALRLGENAFNETVLANLISSSSSLGIPISSLNLYSSGFRKTLPKNVGNAIASSGIKELSLARNQFEMIKPETFGEMTRLEYLDLREVLALNISKDAFANLTRLRTLLLNGNKLSSIPEGVFLEHLTYLDLSENSGDSFTPSYFSLGQRKFSKMRRLKLLNLSYNRLNALYKNAFDGLQELKILGLKNATIFHIYPGTFGKLSKLLILNLENNPFPKNRPLQREVFEGLTSVQVLLLGGCRISSFPQRSPFFHLKSLSHLGLQNNFLTTISPSVFAPLKILKSLDLFGNTLTAWRERILSNNSDLQQLRLGQNKLTSITEEMLQDFGRLFFLDVSSNPFTCDCSLFNTLHQGMYGNNSIIDLLTKNDAQCVYPDATSNFTLSQYVQAQLNSSKACLDSYETSFKIILSTSLGVLLLLIFIFSWLIYRYRWQIQYWFFVAKIALIRKGKIAPKRHNTSSSTSYTYDAFVSYSNDDRSFVIRLVSMLENYEPFLKLCVYERDFQIGAVISENVLQSIGQSRRTVLVISDSYARSQWCRWEAQIAEHHRFFERDNGGMVDDSLILIKLGEVAENHMTPTLKYLMKTRIYLQWNPDEKKQKLFWDKLRNTLTPEESPACVTHL